MIAIGLIVFGGLLILWGLALLLTGEFVATLDIAASLISSGGVLVALAAIVRSLDRLTDRLAASELDIDEALEPEIVAAQSRQRSAEPDFEAEPEPAPAIRSAEPAGSVVIREGEIEGKHYRFFADGSIEEEGPEGVRRYPSIDAVREEMLRERSRNEPPPPAPEARKPAPARPSATFSGGPEEQPPQAAPAMPPAPREERPAPSPAASREVWPAPTPPQEPQPKRTDAPASPTPSSTASEPPAASPPKRAREGAARRQVTWESYLAAGRVEEPPANAPAPPPEPARDPEPPARQEEGAAPSIPVEKKDSAADEEWAAPFRSLLKGEPERPSETKKNEKG